MEFGIFNLMGSRDPAKPSAQTFAEVAEQTKLADELGYAIALPRTGLFRHLPSTFQLRELAVTQKASLLF